MVKHCNGKELLVMSKSRHSHKSFNNQLLVSLGIIFYTNEYRNLICASK